VGVSPKTASRKVTQASRNCSYKAITLIRIRRHPRTTMMAVHLDRLASYKGTILRIDELQINSNMANPRRKAGRRRNRKKKCRSQCGVELPFERRTTEWTWSDPSISGVELHHCQSRETITYARVPRDSELRGTVLQTRNTSLRPPHST
jgi:hypothetical protein